MTTCSNDSNTGPDPHGLRAIPRAFAGDRGSEEMCSICFVGQIALAVDKASPGMGDYEDRLSCARGDWEEQSSFMEHIR